jgi:DNA polymerase III subunit gamma/tau
MSYQVIARKWRPQTFGEVTGQEVITKTLQNAIEHDRLHHAYLFSGARGVGKTTTARILAKALNCHKTDRPTIAPCKWDADDICSSCQEIAESRSIDVLEIDAASHTGIDDVRGTILDSINFSPARDRYKVFVIDEVHQLSKSAFNALLKTLEEPPPNVVFVMATTELHKVPDTILSRCQEFEFRTIPLQKIFDRLREIATAEKIDIDDAALRELARSGMGSMRDAQSNFDQVISFATDKIAVEDVTGSLGFAGVDVLKQVITGVAASDRIALLKVVDDLISRGHDLRNFCRDLLSLFRDMLVVKVGGSSPELLDGAVFAPDELTELAGHFTSANVIRAFNSVAETESALREAATPRYTLEIGLVKLVEFRSVVSIENILERLDVISGGEPANTIQPLAPSIAEKKTLISREPAEPAITVAVEPVAIRPEPQEQSPVERPMRDVGEFEEPEFAPFDDTPEQPEDIHLPPKIWVDPPEWIAGRAPILAPLPAEFAEHFDDAKLDAAYEFKLDVIGEHLHEPLNIGDFLASVFYENNDEPKAAAAEAGANGASQRDVSVFMQGIPVEEDVPLPVLSESPTDDEIKAYANAHPLVRAAKRIFQAEVTETRRI